MTSQRREPEVIDGRIYPREDMSDPIHAKLSEIAGKMDPTLLRLLLIEVYGYFDFPKPINRFWPTVKLQEFILRAERILAR